MFTSTIIRTTTPHAFVWNLRKDMRKVLRGMDREALYWETEYVQDILWYLDDFIEDLKDACYTKTKVKVEYHPEDPLENLCEFVREADSWGFPLGIESDLLLQRAQDLKGCVSWD